MLGVSKTFPIEFIYLSVRSVRRNWKNIVGFLSNKNWESERPATHFREPIVPTNLYQLGLLRQVQQAPGEERCALWLLLGEDPSGSLSGFVCTKPGEQ